MSSAINRYERGKCRVQKQIQKNDLKYCELLLFTKVIKVIFVFVILTHLSS